MLFASVSRDLHTSGTTAPTTVYDRRENDDDGSGSRPCHGKGAGNGQPSGMHLSSARLQYAQFSNALSQQEAAELDRIDEGSLAHYMVYEERSVAEADIDDAVTPYMELLGEMGRDAARVVNAWHTTAGMPVPRRWKRFRSMTTVATTPAGGAHQISI